MEPLSVVNDRMVVGDVAPTQDRKSLEGPLSGHPFQDKWRNNSSTAVPSTFREAAIERAHPKAKEVAKPLLSNLQHSTHFICFEGTR